MKKIITGILAHVDAGKTTLSEGLLYTAGAIRKIGRVDKKDAFLDHDALERARGITIFSKEARLTYKNTEITLLDTPGHVDFSAEMERTLQVLDYAILVISGADGVQGHTGTLWSLLTKYRIPVFLFVNKMDQPGTDREAVMKELKARLHDNCVDFTEQEGESFYEEIAVANEEMLEEFLETGKIRKEHTIEAVKKRQIFPCFFGSALRLQGIEEFLEGFTEFTEPEVYPEEFGARIYKINRDEKGNRLTCMKITGGSLKIRTVLHGEDWDEKVSQIRLYSGMKFETAEEVRAGDVCAVMGLTKTKAGEGLGTEQGQKMPFLEPVLTYRILLPDGADVNAVLPKLLQLVEEDPQLHISWNEELGEIQVQVMGEVQIEVLKEVIKERFHLDVTFDKGSIVYKETILNQVEGVGHFEPLRHYAEVHLLMEPLPPGSGMVFDTICSEDVLDKNWQRLILTHLQEKEYRGVLTGSVITDMKISLAAGRAHQKHTEGGDFRQAVYRAVRQGLMQAESQLLEPYYEFRMELPENCAGRAMTDLERMGGQFAMDYDPGDKSQGQAAVTVLKGSVPVSEMRGYQRELNSYTKGEGRLYCTVKGYAACHRQEEVIKEIGYDPDRDVNNPSGSVFCAHGAGFYVDWYDVRNYMHLGSIFDPVKEDDPGIMEYRRQEREEWIDDDEVDAIINQTFYANRQGKSHAKPGPKRKNREWDTGTTVYYSSEDRKKQFSRVRNEKKKYLLVDGYNVIFAWDDLRDLADRNIDSARDKLLDILSAYQGLLHAEIIAVFDAYRVKGHDREILDFQNIHVVYTKEAETADSYIEKFAHENGRKYDVTVATSDGMEQIIIIGQGCHLLSARELKREIEDKKKQFHEEFMTERTEKHTFSDMVSKETMEQLYNDTPEEK